MDASKTQDVQKRGKASFFETLTEIIGWLQIVASPLIMGLVIGFIIYLSRPDNMGLFIGVAVALVGLIIGIVWQPRFGKRKVQYILCLEFPLHLSLTKMMLQKLFFHNYYRSQNLGL